MRSIASTFSVCALWATGLVSAGVEFPVISAAAPAGFPDLNSFADVNALSYVLDIKGRRDVHFNTPDGLDCGMSYGNDDPSIRTYVWCQGNIPALPENAESWHGESDKVTGRQRDGGRNPYSYSFTRGGGGTPGTWKLLDVGQKISTGNITCVVGADSLTACLNRVDEHGFVLQPSGSWVF